MHEEINQMHGPWMDGMEGLDVDGSKNEWIHAIGILVIIKFVMVLKTLSFFW